MTFKSNPSGFVLPDLLAPDLNIVFCGSAASTVSAEEKAYYAGPGNKFWSTIYEVGLTSRLLLPQEFSALLEFGIGLTDMAKQAYGSDQSIPNYADKPERINKIIIELKPKVMAFVGKRSAKVFYNMKFGLKNMNYGHQNQFIGRTALYVLPSPSGLASRYWDTEPWQDLAQSVKNDLSY